MDCPETPEGYKVMYTPMAPGNYLIGVKYGGPNPRKWAAHSRPR